MNTPLPTTTPQNPNIVTSDQVCKFVVLVGEYVNTCPGGKVSTDDFTGRIADCLLVALGQAVIRSNFDEMPEVRDD